MLGGTIRGLATLTRTSTSFRGLDTETHGASPLVHNAQPHSAPRAILRGPMRISRAPGPGGVKNGLPKKEMILWPQHQHHPGKEPAAYC